MHLIIVAKFSVPGKENPCGNGRDLNPQCVSICSSCLGWFLKWIASNKIQISFVLKG